MHRMRVDEGKTRGFLFNQTGHLIIIPSLTISITYMDTQSQPIRWAVIFRAPLILITGIVIIPLLISLGYAVSLLNMSGLVGSVLILQPMAVLVGMGLGIPPVPIMLVMISFGISIIYGLFAICDAFAERSAWLRKHLDSVHAIALKSPLFQRYGIYTLVPFIWIPGVGLYGCVLLAWLFHWRGTKGVGVIMAGWILSTLIVLAASIGVLDIIK
jgi:uncharacterized membrane protein